MKNRIFTLLIAFFAIAGLSAQNVPTTMPIQFSTNTTDGAIWYAIKTNRNGANADRFWGANYEENRLGVQWHDPIVADATDYEQFCFIGDNTNGFNVYCKAFLKGQTVGGVTLTADIKLQNIKTYADWGGDLGFPVTTTITGNELMDKFVLVEGDGGTHDGFAATDRYLIKVLNEKSLDLSVCNSDGSTAVITTAAWGTQYSHQFAPIAGGTTPTPGAPLFSTNTTDGAVWYIIEWWTHEEGKMLPIGLNTGDDNMGTLGTRWGGKDVDDKGQLFCFVGDASGFEIYNKAALKGEIFDGVTLTEDLKLQNFGLLDPDEVWTNPNPGFTVTPKVTSPNTKWAFEKGTGDAPKDGYKIYSTEDDLGEAPACFRRDGGNKAVLIYRDWDDHYTQHFVYVSGGDIKTYDITVDG